VISANWVCDVTSTQSSPSSWRLEQLCLQILSKLRLQILLQGKPIAGTLCDWLHPRLAFAYMQFINCLHIFTTLLIWFVHKCMSFNCFGFYHTESGHQAILPAVHWSIHWCPLYFCVPFSWFLSLFFELIQEHCSCKKIFLAHRSATTRLLLLISTLFFSGNTWIWNELHSILIINCTIVNTNNLLLYYDIIWQFDHAIN